MRRALICLAVAAGCSAPDPTLTLNASRSALVVGQRASIKVSAGDGADLDERTLQLHDAAGRRFLAAGLEAKRVGAREVSFAVPTTVAPGEAALQILTAQRFAFAAKIQIHRLAAVRDGSGKVWWLALDRRGSVVPSVELSAGAVGAGAGRLLVAPSGRVIAATANGDKELRLATVEAKPQVSQAASVPAEIRDLIFTSAGKLLLATEQGTYLAEWTSPIGPTTAIAIAATPLIGQATLALGADRLGRRGVALVRSTVGQYQLLPLDLTQSPPPSLQAITLPWATDATTTLRVAISGDGNSILATNSKQSKVVLVGQLSDRVAEATLPAFQTEPVAVVARPTGAVFTLLNRGSRNLSVVEVKDGLLVFGNAIDLGAPVESGALVGAAGSGNDEALILLERDLFLVAGGAAKAIKLPTLFADKTTGAPGVAVAIQP